MRIRVSQPAIQDLVEIFDYIARDSLSAADRQMEVMFARFQRLGENPELGQRRPEFAGGDLRAFSAGNYVIFYRIRVPDLEIARVLHAARDIDAILE